MDLSFNSLYNLKGLNGFQTLQELILDNNELNDNIQFPFLPYLHTLSLNKNNVSIQFLFLIIIINDNTYIDNFFCFN